MFWPAVLKGAGIRQPTSVFAHGFLTINGKKMSKSRGTFINGRTYLDHLDPSYIRYYYAAKLGPSMEDIDLNTEDFVARVNSDLVGKLINIASRCSGFISKQFDNQLSKELDNQELFNQFLSASEDISNHFKNREYSKAMRKIISLADEANRYLENKKPWIMIKDEALHKEVQSVCTQGLNLFRILMIYLYPVIPEIAINAMKLFNEKEWRWKDLDSPILGKKIKEYRPLLTRIEKKKVENLMTSKEDHSDKITKETGKITIDDFMKVDLRVGIIDEAKEVEGADKLLKLIVNLDKEKRTIFAGIKSAYKVEDLVGRSVVVAANLAPRKMKFGTSEGMILAAGPGGDQIFLLSTDEGAKPGMKIK